MLRLIQCAYRWVRRQTARWLTNEVGYALAIPLVIVSLISIGMLVPRPSQVWLRVTAILWGIWAIAPPFFFLMQWFAFDEPRTRQNATGDSPTREKRLENLKYSHELASKFWLGGVAILSGSLLYAHDEMKEARPPTIVSCASDAH